MQWALFSVPTNREIMIASHLHDFKMTAFNKQSQEQSCRTCMGLGRLVLICFPRLKVREGHNNNNNNKLTSNILGVIFEQVLMSHLSFCCCEIVVVLSVSVRACLSLCLYLCLSLRLSVSVYLSVRVSVCLSLCLRQSVYLILCPCQFVYLSVHPSVSVCLSVCLSRALFLSL